MHGKRSHFTVRLQRSLRLTFLLVDTLLMLLFAGTAMSDAAITSTCMRNEDLMIRCSRCSTLQPFTVQGVLRFLNLHSLLLSLVRTHFRFSSPSRFLFYSTTR